MEYNVDRYNLVIKYNNNEIEYITGFENNSSIIYDEFNKVLKGKNGFYTNNGYNGSIEFILKEGSQYIKRLLELKEKNCDFRFEIHDGNDDSKVEVSGSPYNIISKNTNNTNWIVNGSYKKLDKN